jgi:hypothetical protein
MAGIKGKYSEADDCADKNHVEVQESKHVARS